MAFANYDPVHIDAKFSDQILGIPIRQGQGFGQNTDFNIGSVQFSGRSEMKNGDHGRQH